MASLSNAKTLGGVGGILVFIPGISLVGWILILVALKDISEVLQDRTIFDDALLAGIMAIIGAAVLVVPFFGFFLAGFAFLFIWAVLALFAVFAIISAVFLKRAYDKVSPRLNIPSFATAGLLFLIGTITTIILVGFLILFIALIFQVIAYFSIRDRPTPGPYPGFQPSPPMYTTPPTMPQSAPMQPPPAIPLPTAQPQADSKFCFKCGARLPRTADFCTSCGTKLS